MSTSIVKKLELIENIMCVYRNYYSLSKVSRAIFWLRLLLLIILYAVDIFFEITYLSDIYLRRLIIYVLNVVVSGGIIIISLYQSKNYDSFLRYFDKNSHLFSKDAIYIKELDRIYKMVIIFHAIYFTLSTIIQIFYNIIDIHASNYVVVVIHTLIMFECICRFLTEYIFMWALLSILSERVKFITRNILEERVMPVLSMDWESEEVIVIEKEVTSFDEWKAQYNDVKECSNLINSIFGLQVSYVEGVYEFVSLL